MRRLPRPCRPVLLPLAALILPLAATAQERALDGQAIHDFFSSDSWEAEVDFYDGMHTRIVFLPNGKVQGVNIYGGGSLHGRWHADLANDWLCLSWEARGGPLTGCMAVTRIGNEVVELRSTDTDEMLWHMDLENF